MAASRAIQASDSGRVRYFTTVEEAVNSPNIIEAFRKKLALTNSAGESPARQFRGVLTKSPYLGFSSTAETDSLGARTVVWVLNVYELDFGPSGIAETIFHELIHGVSGLKTPDGKVGTRAAVADTNRFNSETAVEATTSACLRISGIDDHNFAGAVKGPLGPVRDLGSSRD